MSTRKLQADILVAGAGAAGLAAGLALAREGFEVVVAGPLDLRPTARTVALLEGSVRLLRTLGVWELVEQHATPLETMRIIDDTGSLFRPPPVEFHAGELGLDAFGYNIENRHLIEALGAEARSRLELAETMVEDIAIETDVVRTRLADGTSIETAALAGADGRNSKVRTAAAIGVREKTGDQVALTALLRHTRPHHNVSTEFHTRGGPFTLVPMPALPGAPHRSSLVWLMPAAQARRLAALDEAGLARAIETQAQSFLGAMQLEGPRGRFPMSSMTAERFGVDRVALVGEAAHVFPPIGAQGLNLGMRDAAHLAEALADARAAGADWWIEGPRAYDELRAADIGVRAAGVNTLNSALLTGLLPVDLLRGFGLLALSGVGPLRRMVMRQGLMPGRGSPRLMAAPPPPQDGHLPAFSR